MPRQRLYQRVYQVKNLLKNVLTGKKVTDDFDWDIYTQHYKGELKQVEEIESTVIQPGNYQFQNNTLVKVTDMKPLHLNHHLIYETIGQLKPVSVLEVGCGGGDHLHNLSVLYPDVKIYGEDLSDKQLKLLHQRHPDLKAKVQQHNIASHQLASWPPIDLVFTQAVVMHIKTGDNHRTALKNIFHMAQKYVILMENWRSHDFVKDILDLQAKGELGWPEFHLYSRPYTGTTHPYLLVASRVPLPQYQPLRTDDELRVA
ncbi:MAG: class I SAM-dependent methyltransferase [Candidatus Kerfeldbacteria bacterium]|nr:class I SAM-dependent methyltransferase [Candidatus Kerfeldbacteria bacterium]